MHDVNRFETRQSTQCGSAALTGCTATSESLHALLPSHPIKHAICLFGAGETKRCAANGGACACRDAYYNVPPGTIAGASEVSKLRAELQELRSERQRLADQSGAAAATSQELDRLVEAAKRKVDKQQAKLRTTTARSQRRCGAAQRLFGLRTRGNRWPQTGRCAQGSPHGLARGSGKGGERLPAGGAAG